MKIAQQWKKWGLIGCSLLLLLVPFFVVPQEESSGGMIAFLGRFHPMIVHFPIVLVSLPLLFELIGVLPQWRFLKRSNTVLLWLALASTIMAVVMGIFLYQSGGYGGELVRQHLWGGVLLSVGLLITIGSYTIQGRQWIYFTALAVSNVLLIFTGHIGGSLTHGEEYLTELMLFTSVRAPIEQKSEEEYRVLDDLLVPIFTSKCQSCHNPNKVKGGLLLTSYADMVKGGKSGKPGLVPGDPEASEIMVRVMLPEEDDDHMPPSGKTGLNEAEIGLLKWWIEEGADSELILGEVANDQKMKSWLSDMMPGVIQQHRQRWKHRQEVEAYLEEVRPFTDRWGLVVGIDDARDSTRLSVSMRIPPAPVNDQFLGELVTYGDVFSKLSLPATEITDDGLFHLGTMTELRELLLQRSCINGDGLVYLKELPHLEVLNLSFTEVDDVAALHLLDFPALKKVYLFHSEVGENVVEALRAHLPEVEVLMEEGPYF